LELTHGAVAVVLAAVGSQEMDRRRSLRCSEGGKTWDEVSSIEIKTPNKRLCWLRRGSEIARNEAERQEDFQAASWKELDSAGAKTAHKAQELDHGSPAFESVS